MQLSPSTNDQAQPGCFAVKVRTRAEVTVSEVLRRKGYDVLTPTCAMPSGRSKNSKAALFPGYIFVRLDPTKLLPLVTTEGVSYVVRSGSSLRPLATEEELTVKILCELREGCEPWNQLTVGQTVSIETGPLQGRRGTLLRIGDRDRLIISLSSIFSSVSVDLRDTIVKACN